MSKGRRELPIGIQTFKKIRDKVSNFIYIDKTQQILDLTKGGGYYFLSRPRRFGKSLLIDTIAELFQGNRELFEELYIYDKWNWETKYPVIRIDFTKGEFNSKESLDYALKGILAKICSQFDIDKEGITDKQLGVYFGNIIEAISNKYNQQVVILVDEYDKPILDTIDTPELAKEIRNLLRHIYSNLKSADRYIRFGMLTGVSKFSQMTLFSGANNLNDITIDRDYATIAGYTHNDLKSQFVDYLKDVDLEEVRRWYNGYNYFGDPIYNPFDILLFLSKGCEFRNYWWQTGTPQFLIEQLKERDYNIPNLQTIKVRAEILNSFDIEHIDIVALLWQTGYLTFDKKVTKIPGRTLYKMKVPNMEVQTSLNALILSNLIGNINNDDRGDRVIDAVSDQNMEQFKLELESLFAAIPYTNYTKNQIADYEGYYSSVIFAFLASLGFEVKVEDATSAGRIDMTIIGTDAIFILEFKVDSHNGSAIEQIENKKYHQKYLNENKKIFLIGIQFDSEERNIASFDYKVVSSRYHDSTYVIDQQP